MTVNTKQTVFQEFGLASWRSGRTVHWLAKTRSAQPGVVSPGHQWGSGWIVGLCHVCMYVSVSCVYIHICVMCVCLYLCQCVHVSVLCVMYVCICVVCTSVFVSVRLVCVCLYLFHCVSVSVSLCVCMSVSCMSVYVLCVYACISVMCACLYLCCACMSSCVMCTPVHLCHVCTSVSVLFVYICTSVFVPCLYFCICVVCVRTIVAIRKCLGLVVSKWVCMLSECGQYWTVEMASQLKNTPVSKCCLLVILPTFLSRHLGWG